MPWQGQKRREGDEAQQRVWSQEEEQLAQEQEQEQE